MNLVTPASVLGATDSAVGEAVQSLARRRRTGQPDSDFHPSTLDAWARCIRSGLQPGAVRPIRVRDLEADTRLIEVVARALEPRLHSFQDCGVCVSLTDHGGVLLRQWSGNRPMLRNLERFDIAPGFIVDETTIGNSSGSSLLTRTPTIVHGPEHFARQFAELTSAGNVITHPITRRVIGSLNLTCEFTGRSPMALTWICEIVADIERRLLESATAAEQDLLRCFLAENRDARHAVVAVNAQTVIANATATMLVGSLDQAMLWEFASAALAAPESQPTTVPTSNGSRLRVECSAVPGAGEQHGVVMRLSRVQTARRGRATPLVSLPDLVGGSPRWIAMRKRLARIGHAPLLLVGAAGVGKRAIARTLAGATVIEVDARDGQAPAEVRRILSDDPSTVLVHHVADMSGDRTDDLVDALAQLPSTTRLIGTSRTTPSTGALSAKTLQLFHEIVPVPDLHDRPEDIPALVTALTKRHSGARRVHWMPDALKALSRNHWPENIRSLERLVQHVILTSTRDYVGVGDLPAHVASKGARRQFGGLERVEAEALLQALRDSNGNKQRAAELLGIARSTLYRKIRALGLNTDSSF